MYIITSWILSNMKMGYIILVCLLLSLVSCEKEPCIDVEYGNQPIYLSASMENGVQAKSPYTDMVPSQTTPLAVDIWASTTSGIFKHIKENSGSNGLVSYHSSATFQSADSQLLDTLVIYPKPVAGQPASSVYFISMHPQSTESKKWTTLDGGSASFTFTGYEDVMFAPQVSGQYQEGVEVNAQNLKFKHLLTRITAKMQVVAEAGENKQDILDAWGKITDLQISSYNAQLQSVENKNSLTIRNLSKDFGQWGSLTDDVVLKGEIHNTSMDFYRIGTDMKFPESGGYTLTDRPDSVAYVMCAPTLATYENHEYVITVTTEKRGVVEVKLDLQQPASSATGVEKFIGSTMGKHFSVTLRFKKGRAIATVATVEPWDNGGFGSGNIYD